MKRILINATQQEELRVAIVDGQKLYNLDIEVPSKEQKKSSIFKGKITRVEQSLEAAFVDFGSERHGFLPFKEIAKEYWSDKALDSESRPSIKDAVKEGQELIVQVEKEERGNKGAALTTKISLAGRYLVLMPTESRAGGVSRRIEGEERTQVREAMAQLNIPEKMGCIVRTAGVGRGVDELQWDLDYLATLWEAIAKAGEELAAPRLLYHDTSVIIRALRDHYSSEIGEIIVDDPAVFNQAQDFVRQVMPHNLRKLKLYDEKVPLFSRFQIESQIESAFRREVSLPSGGAIVIDPTEALTSIDVNSARATKGGDIEETALHTNLEAADEIARQLRLRDLGGLFVIDFIDMLPNRNQREVENRLKEALKADRARVQVSRISRFGLLEMSRQRLRPSLGESSHEVCPRCSGHGTVRSVESMALSILRLIEEESNKEKTGAILAHLPVEVATYLLNEKRTEIAGIEKRQEIRVILVPDANYERPNFKLERVRDADTAHAALAQPSHELVESSDVQYTVTDSSASNLSAQAAVQSVSVAPPPPPPARAPAPTVATTELQRGPGLIVRLWHSLFAPMPEVEEKPAAKKPSGRRTQPSKGGSQQKRSRDGGGRTKSGGQKQDRRKNEGRGTESRDGSKRSDRKPAADKRKAADDNRDKSTADKQDSSSRRKGSEKGGEQPQRSGKSRSNRSGDRQQGRENKERTQRSRADKAPKALKDGPGNQGPEAKKPKEEQAVVDDSKTTSTSEPMKEGSANSSPEQKENAPRTRRSRTPRNRRSRNRSDRNRNQSGENKAVSADPDQTTAKPAENQKSVETHSKTTSTDDSKASNTESLAPPAPAKSGEQAPVAETPAREHPAPAAKKPEVKEKPAEQSTANARPAAPKKPPKVADSSDTENAKQIQTEVKPRTEKANTADDASTPPKPIEIKNDTPVAKAATESHKTSNENESEN